MNVTDGTLPKIKTEILKRLAEYFDALFNSVNPIEFSASYELPSTMDLPIAENKVTRAINSLKAGKAAGPGGLPPETFTHGGRSLVSFLS